MDTAQGFPVGIEAELGKYYPWQENTNMDFFKAHIVAMRTWMEERGYRDKPLIISEYGVLYPCSHWDTLPRPVVWTASMRSWTPLLSTCSPPPTTRLAIPPMATGWCSAWSWFSLNCPTYEQAPGVGFEGNLSDPYSRSEALTRIWGTF